MALNLEVLRVIEDIDPTTRAARLRAEVRELKPRTLLVNLKNCNAEQIGIMYANVGGILSIPAREMLMDGRFMLSIAATDDDFFIIRPPEKIPVANTVTLNTVGANPTDKPLNAAKS